MQPEDEVASQKFQEIGRGKPSEVRMSAYCPTAPTDERQIRVIDVTHQSHDHAQEHPLPLAPPFSRCIPIPEKACDLESGVSM